MTQADLHTKAAKAQLSSGNKIDEDDLFAARKASNLSLIQYLYFSLYPQEEFERNFDRLWKKLDNLMASRPAELKSQDVSRILEGRWFQSQHLVGMQLYVDRFAKNIKGLQKRLPYLEDLGVNFLHVMPLTTRPKGPSDGGYAVNNYTKVDPSLGSNKDLDTLTKNLRERKMLLMLDFVVNHTSDEFEWAKKAKKGKKKYQAYYYTYPNREIPDQFEASLPEIFPETSPGNFTFDKDMNRWVMTVFNSYQWDLNYRNPDVFEEMLTQLVQLVNLGVDVVRFDALAFLWKKLGTISQNLPEAHQLISLFRLCLQTVAPGVILLAEAIVAPRDILTYFGKGPLEGNECELAYNATLMALLWNSIATTKTQVLYRNLTELPHKPLSTSWINYIRCHDDIGLGFDDKYIYEAGWDAQLHRKFLREYFSGDFPGSPSKGGIFMYNPKTADGRIVGNTASLVGLEKAREEKNDPLKKQALDKIVMLHGIMLSYGGIPMLYAGDELALLNDYSYLKEPDKKDDNRWMNRPFQPWEVVDSFEKKDSDARYIHSTLKKMIGIRKKEPCLADPIPRTFIDLDNPHLLGYWRTLPDSDASLIVLANFSPQRQTIRLKHLFESGYPKAAEVVDLISEKKISLKKGWITIKPFQLFWLKRI
ncbi:MAG: alpha-amylase family glycosyl hydrolase [Flavobacteriaceae bacterium]|nr:alpha-amylase family glycosyl hydrolase [Flavobacteriaceae bacterium]MDH3795474.1 alpha-amylase family glycosyl hydrolase [Flavobacteriaceae bacterium]